MIDLHNLILACTTGVGVPPAGYHPDMVKTLAERCQSAEDEVTRLQADVERLEREGMKVSGELDIDVVGDIQGWWDENPHPVNNQAREAIYLLYRAHREIVRLRAERQLIAVEDALKISRCADAK